MLVIRMLALSLKGIWVADLVLSQRC